MKKKVLLTATVQSHICQFHRPLVEVLHELGYEVHVAARDNLAEKNGLKLDFVDAVYDIPFARSPKSLDNIEAYIQLKRIIKKTHYDVIHCNTPMGGIVTRLAAIKSRKNGSKVFYTAHGFHFYKGAPIKNWILFYPIEKLFARITDKIITITDEDYVLAKSKFQSEIEHVFGVGVDEERYHPVSVDEQLSIKNKLGFSVNQRIVLCVGELLPNKNQRMAVRMMKDVADCVSNVLLLIAGNGPEEDAIKEEISRCGLDNNVKMLGYCTCLEYYQRISDIIVACSYREGLPLNIVEAMLTENPVVATENRGHRELIKNEKNGYLVSNEKDMSHRVIELLQNSEKKQAFGDNARNTAQKYSVKTVKAMLKQIYLE